MAKLQPLLLYPAYLAQGLLRERVVSAANHFVNLSNPNPNPTPEPRTPNPDPRTPNPEPRTPTSDLRPPTVGGQRVLVSHLARAPA